MNLDLLKRPLISGTVIGVLVLAIIWWLAWMTPEGHKLNSVNQQQVSLQSQISTLNAEIASLKLESAQVSAELPYLRFFQTAIPVIPESGVLTEQLYNLSLKTGTTMSSLNDSQPASTGLGYSVIPVTMQVSGSHDSVLAFLKGLYTLPRLITIQSLSLSPPAQNLNKASKTAGFSASIAASAYTTFVPLAPA